MTREEDLQIMNEQELLAVLDMSEEEQQMIWLIKKEVMVGAVLQCKGGGELPCPSESNADLAFRLREEMDMEQWPALAEAYECVRNKWCNDTWPQRHSMGLNKKHISSSLFWLFHSKPIHWIIAALIAKEIENE